jgi:Cys-tRNA(Pro) deacylase
MDTQNQKYAPSLVSQILKENNLPDTVRNLPDSTHTAKQAAKALDCSVGQIAKSLIFLTEDTNKLILIVASGANHVDTQNFKNYLGERIKMAPPKLIKEEIGYSVGGVPPFGHKQNLHTYIDNDLMQFTKIWAAAGSSHSVFSISPKSLLRITNASTFEN